MDDFWESVNTGLLDSYKTSNLTTSVLLGGTAWVQNFIGQNSIIVVEPLKFVRNKVLPNVEWFLRGFCKCYPTVISLQVSVLS